MLNEKFDSQLSPETLDDRVIAEAFQKVKLHFDEGRIQPEEFIGIYPKAVVEEDEMLAEELERKFEQVLTPEKKLAIVFEEIFADQIEANQWLGENILAQRTSRFDDFKNGADVILEIRDAASARHLAIAIDVTYGSNLEKKFVRIKQEIDAGTLTNVKYFKDSEGKKLKDGLPRIPRVIIGLKRETVIELAKLWVNRKNKELAAHPVQAEIIEEILLQLTAHRNYAKRFKKDDLVAIYDEQLALLQEIQTEKQAMFGSTALEYRTNDPVFGAIRTAAENLNAIVPPPEKKFIPLKERSNNPWLYR
jgi:hypothetical protein